MDSWTEVLRGVGTLSRCAASIRFMAVVVGVSSLPKRVLFTMYRTSSSVSSLDSLRKMNPLRVVTKVVGSGSKGRKRTVRSGVDMNLCDGGERAAGQGGRCSAYLVDKFFSLFGSYPRDEGAVGRCVSPAFGLWDRGRDDWVCVQAHEALDFVAELGDYFPVLNPASVGSVDKDLVASFGGPERPLGHVEVFKDGVPVPAMDVEILWGGDGDVG